MPVACRLVCLSIMVLAAGCQIPQDIEKTLERVRGGVMNVGATENPPWVIRGPDGAAGLEAELVAALAEQLDADIRWHWGNESELLSALEQFQLDLVVGGLVQSPRLGQRIALTNPYYESRLTVGFPLFAASLPKTLEGLQVGVASVSHLGKPLRDQGAVPLRLDDPRQANIPVAHASWWLEAHGLQPGDWELAVDKHVMALPPGENAWMLAVQRHLNAAAGLEKRLQELEAGR